MRSHSLNYKDMNIKDLSIPVVHVLVLLKIFYCEGLERKKLYDSRALNHDSTDVCHCAQTVCCLFNRKFLVLGKLIQYK